MGVLYGRAGRLSTESAGFRPAQFSENMAEAYSFAGAIFFGAIILTTVLCKPLVRAPDRLLVELEDTMRGKRDPAMVRALHRVLQNDEQNDELFAAMDHGGTPGPPVPRRPTRPAVPALPVLPVEPTLPALPPASFEVDSLELPPRSRASERHAAVEGP